jgi:hypothetical protein
MWDDGYAGRARAHLGEALRWNRETEFEFAEGIIAGLGFVGPILLAALFGDLPLGLAASAGSLPIGTIAAGRSAAEQARNLALALMPTLSAAGVAVALADAGWEGKVLVVVLAGIAALVGGYSRTAAIVTTRFTLFLIITLSLAAATPHRLLLLLLLAAGAIWTALLWLLFGIVARLIGSAAAVADGPQPPATAAEKRTRWRASLRQFGGWQYVARLTLCLTAAAALDLGYAGHHLHWILLTIVLLALPISCPSRSRSAHWAPGSGGSSPVSASRPVRRCGC